MKTQPPNMVGKEPGHAVQPQDPPAPLQPDLELLGTEVCESDRTDLFCTRLMMSSFMARLISEQSHIFCISPPD